MLATVLLVAAFLCFLAATFDVVISRINPIAAGLTFLTLAMLVAQFII